MNTKLDNITTQYRKFNDNQALTEGQLNEFIDYFEDQDRLSRTRLSGVGVVCGFKSGLVGTSSLQKIDLAQERELYLADFKYINIKQGAGVTTDGDLITLRKTDPKSQEISIDFESHNYSHYREYKDTLRYPHFFNKDKQMQLLELVTSEEYEILLSEGSNALDFFPVNAITRLDKKIVILYLESYSNEESPCEDANCDNNGAEQVSNLRVLLADQDDVENFMVNGDAKDGIFQQHNGYEELYEELKDIEAKRVILSSSVTTAESLRIKFQDAVQSPTILKDLSDGFSAIAKTFKIDMFFGGFSLADKLKQVLNTSGGDYQYRYDLLKDLIDTYNEIKELVLHLKFECCPEIASFSKHLMLGPVGATLGLGDHTPYRHNFYNSPITTNDDENHQRLVFLANRFVQKINDFQTFSGQIKITPSKRYAHLGEKALPIYYNVTKKLLEKWNFEKTQLNRETFNLSYHTNNLASVNFVQNPLLYSIDDTDFYRVEGHLGLPYKTALKNINDLRTKNNLAFQVYALVLRKGKNDAVRREISTAIEEPTIISIKELRDKLISISSDISNDSKDPERTLQTISGLDSQLKMLNTAEFAPSLSGVSVIKQNPKEDDAVSELLSEFLERKSGLEHVGGVDQGGSIFLIYDHEDNNKVIADFSLPYLCCSKKDPVFLVFPAEKLCKNDAAIPVTVLPLDGIIKAFASGTEVKAIKQIGGQNFFDPSLVADQHLEQPITFTVDDDPVDTKIVVHGLPNVSVTTGEIAYGDDKDNPDATVFFKATIVGSLEGLEYEWDFGDGSPIVKTDVFPQNGIFSHPYNLIAGQEDIYNPKLTVINANGCSTQFNVAPLTLTGQSTVSCLNGMRIVVQYKTGKSPGHGCNDANFNLKGNNVLIKGLTPNTNPNVKGNIYLSNTLGSNDQRNYPVGEPQGTNPNRYSELIITQEEAQEIASKSTDGFISFALECALPSCHTGVAWTQIFLADNPIPIYDNFPKDNFLSINPCTGEIKK